MTPTRTGTGPPASRARAAAAALDQALGDPAESARRTARLDEAEEFPAELCAALDAFGLPAHYVPTRHGGALDDHEELLHLWRTVARRDLSATVAHAKTYLGAVCVWIAGSPEQTRATAAAVLDGTPVAWALTEPDHGADLLNNELTATAHPDGYRLDGTKWPINNATRAGLLTLLARTGPAGSPRGHSLLVVDKATLAPGTWRHLPKAHTHGIRGIDISGIGFDGATLPRQALLGPEGTGVETVLRGLQLTRTMCAALSLGAGEHGLRLAARFTATRVIQKRPLAERPHPASILARCAALLAATEAAALLAARSIHSLTGELGVTAATVKALAPTLVDSVLGELAELLGARSFLTDVPEYGGFQKVARDHQIVAVFDGSTPVNRAALVQQFPALVRGHATGAADTAGLAEAAAAGRPPGPLEYDALTLASRRGSSVVQSLPALAAALRTRPTPSGLAEHAAALSGLTELLHTRMAALRPAARPPMAAHELAAAYELCFAGAACLHLWTAGEHDHAGEPLWADGLWVRAALRAVRERLAALLRTPAPAPAPGDGDLDGTIARVITDAATTGAPVTPFGAPAPRAGEAA
ncbi:acyl-CoA dehydrogenase family protein [Kitasatospora sp. RG8]|uniref:acyl-CoA dehydrogenase family protein n=1 Tax=Kitasatospora sp. RG8 TaxID=2820815 RepID=UPI001ADF9DB7|nr:acyl-CoA dehydrogenase family protein [Kitasatospora sp. RG8]MBP0455619.1 acyl-CoA dehydrogenase family protein [Kitasatospora sp. RG8]